MNFVKYCHILYIILYCTIMFLHIQTQGSLPHDSGAVKTEVIISATVSPLAVVSTILLVACLCCIKIRMKRSATVEGVRSQSSDHIYEEVQLPVPVEVKLKGNTAYELTRPYAYI